MPEATRDSFWLNGTAWQYPDYENADIFIDQIMRSGLLVQDAMVDTVLQCHHKDMSLRSVQRRFLQSTGLTQSTVCQMERARMAKELLHKGTSILDTIEQTGYYDQTHLSRSLKHFIGLTPNQIIQR